MADDDYEVDPFGADLPDGESVVVSARGAGAARQAVLRPSSVANASPAQHDALHALQGAALAVREAQGDLRVAVEHARTLGVSWGVVGWCVGTSGEAARQRFDPEFVRSRPGAGQGRRRR